MRPFILTFVLTVVTAGGFWWYQRKVLENLQSELTAKSTSRIAAAPQPPAAKQHRKKAPKISLRRPDGSPLVTSRGALRGVMEAAAYVRTLGRGPLEALLTGEEPDNIGESGGLILAGWGRLGEMDPRAALALAVKKEETEMGFYIVLNDWLIRDRAAALAWFHEQPDGKEKANFMSVAGLVLASSDPTLLGELSGSIQDPALQRKSLTQGIIAQSMTDPDAAIARLDELKDSESREEVVHSLIMMQGTRRPRSVLELALPMAVESPSMQQQLGGLIREDSREDPAGTLAWLAGRSAAEIAALRTDSTRFPLNSTGSLDPATMNAAAARFESPADREWLMANYYSGRGTTDPRADLEGLAASVTDEKLLAEATSSILIEAARSGQEANLEPWLAARPAKQQAALRAQIADWKASTAKP